MWGWCPRFHSLISPLWFLCLKVWKPIFDFFVWKCENQSGNKCDFPGWPGPKRLKVLLYPKSNRILQFICWGSRIWIIWNRLKLTSASSLPMPQLLEKHYWFKIILSKSITILSYHPYYPNCHYFYLSSSVQNATACGEPAPADSFMKVLQECGFILELWKHSIIIHQLWGLYLLCFMNVLQKWNLILETFNHYYFNMLDINRLYLMSYSFHLVDVSWPHLWYRIVPSKRGKDAP